LLSLELTESDGLADSSELEPSDEFSDDSAEPLFEEWLEWEWPL